jgi:uncharacterized protein YbjT (DUF2867 family)
MNKPQKNQLREIPMPRRSTNETENQDREPVAVIGASGTMGQCAVASLLQRRARFKVMARDVNGLAHLPPHVERVSADASRIDDLLRALDGVRAVFYVSPHTPDEERLAENVVRAVERTGTRLVFAGVHIDGTSKVTRALMRVLLGLHAPHYRAKMRAAETARCARDSIVLMPSNFCQNDELFRGAILGGTFPSPLAHGGMNRVDVRDVGDAAARALLDPTLRAGAYPVIGPASPNGPECAATWSRELGYDVRYTGESDDWKRFVDAALTGHKRDDYLASFALLRGYALPTNTEHLRQTTELLGKPPRTYAEYVHDTARRWRTEQAA